MSRLLAEIVVYKSQKRHAGMLIPLAFGGSSTICLVIYTQQSPILLGCTRTFNFVIYSIASHYKSTTMTKATPIVIVSLLAFVALAATLLRPQVSCLRSLETGQTKAHKQKMTPDCPFNRGCTLLIFIVCRMAHTLVVWYFPVLSYLILVFNSIFMHSFHRRPSSEDCRLVKSLVLLPLPANSMALPQLPGAP